jgi:hypothetical protein
MNTKSGPATTNRKTWVDLHDARVESVLHPTELEYVVAFSHLYVFEEVGRDDYEGWSYRAALHLLRVKAVEWNGEQDGECIVGDASVVGAGGIDLSLDTESFGIDAKGQCSEVSFHFGSGVRLRIVAEAFRFDSTQRVRFVETWKGPLA